MAQKTNSDGPKSENKNRKKVHFFGFRDGLRISEKSEKLKFPENFRFY